MATYEDPCGDNEEWLEFHPSDNLMRWWYLSAGQALPDFLVEQPLGRRHPNTPTAIRKLLKEEIRTLCEKTMSLTEIAEEIGHAKRNRQAFIDAYAVSLEQCQHSPHILIGR